MRRNCVWFVEEYRAYYRRWEPREWHALKYEAIAAMRRLNEIHDAKRQVRKYTAEEKA